MSGADAVVLWKEFGYRPFLDGWNEDPAHKGGEDSIEGRWLPLAAHDAREKALRALFAWVECADAFHGVVSLAESKAWNETLRRHGWNETMPVVPFLDGLRAKALATAREVLK